MVQLATPSVDSFTKRRCTTILYTESKTKEQLKDLKVYVINDRTVNRFQERLNEQDWEAGLLSLISVSDFFDHVCAIC